MYIYNIRYDKCETWKLKDQWKRAKLKEMKKDNMHQRTNKEKEKQK